MYDQITTWENLLHAYHKAAKGKRGRANVARFGHRLEENLLQLQEELQTQAYQPGEYVSFYIHEPKRRLISAAPFRDRIVHHALCNVIEPIFEQSFISDSYANRVGRGTHRALKRVQYFARRYPYALQCDIRQFFPSVDHEILRQTLYRKAPDERVRWLISEILLSGKDVLAEQYEMVYYSGDDLFAVNRHRGLPIGNLTSQFWANCYMNPFDHFVKRELRCRAYLRYVDDFILFGQSKALLWRWKAELESRLEKLRLTIHPGATPKPVSEGIPFLGFITFPEHRRLKRRKGILMRRKLRLLRTSLLNGHHTSEQLHASIQGWVNHVRYGNTIGLRKATLKEPVMWSSKQQREL
jgi:retron-type reverse transcriptase